jgi:hypothetical protein
VLVGVGVAASVVVKNATTAIPVVPEILKTVSLIDLPIAQPQLSIGRCCGPSLPSDLEYACLDQWAGAARGAASSLGSWDHPGLHRQQAVALHFLAGELAGTADSFRLLPRFLFRGFLVMAAELHLAEDALAQHLLLQHLEGLVDIVVTDENLHASFLFNPTVDSISLPTRPRRARTFVVLKRLEVHAAHLT